MRDVKLEKTPQKNSRGEYIKHLTLDGVIWMSNDDHEYADITRALKNAHGDCLVGGVGMGLVLFELARTPSVTSVTAVEILPEVLRLVENQLSEVFNSASKELVIINDNCLEKLGPKNYYHFIYGDWWLEPTKNAYEEYLQWINKLTKNNKIDEKTIKEAWLKPRLEAEIFWS